MKTSMELAWNESWITRRKACPSAAWSTTNPAKLPWVQEPTFAVTTQWKTVWPMTRTTSRTHLQHPLWQPRLLCQLLQIFGVGILVDGEVRLHGPQLMVLERSPHPFCPLLLAVPGRRYRCVVGQWFHGWGEISWVQHFCRTRRIDPLLVRHPNGWKTCACCLLFSLATGHVQGKYSSIYVNFTTRYPVFRLIKSRRMRWAGM